ncbi:pyridoxamine 5'-phosphate oxidase family protein [Leifsonia virtsii]|uniref:Pyridoxamine 5'-phosphate oxidase family protein n=1 Tax=Leifsonia virtsii TaxID=3035915 RepID=A0ABT8IVG7_9MICO|nr:pyridoxamine 5'-phosphate oxidase family protein [Leifsonia virtsii]MDN4596814.1 pyridoxamine 5'-phosphate oxidase family protein [Leifsonia virtsii]
MLMELTRDEIDDVLADQIVGRLGLVDGSTPYVVPISYAYRDGDIYAHSAQGRKLDALRSHPEVCFEVDDVSSVDDWRSVIAWGFFEQLVGADAREGLDILLDRFRPVFAEAGAEHPGAEIGMMRTLDIPRSASAGPDLGRPGSSAAVYRIRLETVTGRAERPR